MPFLFFVIWIPSWGQIVVVLLIAMELQQHRPAEDPTYAKQYEHQFLFSCFVVKTGAIPLTDATEVANLSSRIAAGVA